MSKKTNLDKLREAWDVAPKGAKERLYKHFNYWHFLIQKCYPRMLYYLSLKNYVHQPEFDRS